MYENRPETAVVIDRMDWARSYSKLGGALESPRRGLFLLSPLGREILSLPEDQAIAQCVEMDREVRRPAARRRSRWPQTRRRTTIEVELPDDDDDAWKEPVLRRLHALVADRVRGVRDLPPSRLWTRTPPSRRFRRRRHRRDRSRPDHTSPLCSGRGPSEAVRPRLGRLTRRCRPVPARRIGGGSRTRRLRHTRTVHRTGKEGGDFRHAERRSHRRGPTLRPHARRRGRGEDPTRGRRELLRGSTSEPSTAGQSLSSVRFMRSRRNAETRTPSDFHASSEARSSSSMMNSPREPLAPCSIALWRNSTM